MAANLQGEILIRVLLAIAVLILVAGCIQNEGEKLPSTITVQPELEQAVNTNLVHSPNRMFGGRGEISIEPFEIDVSDAVGGQSWLVGANSSGINASDGGSTWSVVDAHGGWATFAIENDPVSERVVATRIEAEATGRPAIAINSAVEDGSPQFTETRLPDLELNATMSNYENLPDGMSAFDDRAYIYSYADPTERYPHGALGDQIEWTSLVAGEVRGNRELARYRLAEEDVFEGLYPLVEDFDGIYGTKIITTVSNPDDGSRLVVFEYDVKGLRVIAESEPIGTGFRWLHQIAAASFGPNREMEIAVVRTPHIGGIVQYYRLVGNRLELVASKAGGYMSHVNGSRNLDQAVAGDFDGDGRLELLVPSRDQEKLIALRRVGDSVEEVWELELGSRLASNLAVVQTRDESLILGAVTEDGKLLIWQ